MKNTLLKISAAALFSSVAPAGATLVHHYTFDDLVSGGNATDSVGGATGIWDGDAGTNIAVAGLIGAGASQTNDQDGGNGQEHYTIGDLSGINGAGAVSISLWYAQNNGANQNSTYNGLFMSRFAESSFGGGGENWGIALEDNVAPRHIDWRIDGVPGTETDDLLEDSSWHHVVFVWDGVASKRALYHDGALLSEEAGPAGTMLSGNSWDIGNDTCCGSREFTGTLDDISVWSSALNLGGVQSLYNGGLAGLNAAQVPEPGAMALLAMSGLLVLRRRRA